MSGWASAPRVDSWQDAPQIGSWQDAPVMDSSAGDARLLQAEGKVSQQQMTHPIAPMDTSGMVSNDFAMMGPKQTPAQQAAFEVKKTVNAGKLLAIKAYTDVAAQLQKGAQAIAPQASTPQGQQAVAAITNRGPDLQGFQKDLEQQQAEPMNQPQTVAGKVAAGTFGVGMEAPLFMLGAGPGRATGEFIASKIPETFQRLRQIIPALAETSGSFAGEAAARGKSPKEIGLSAGEGLAMGLGGEFAKGIAESMNATGKLARTIELIGQAGGLLTASSAESGQAPTADDVGTTVGTLVALTLAHKGLQSLASTTADHVGETAAAKAGAILQRHVEDTQLPNASETARRAMEPQGPAGGWKTAPVVTSPSESPPKIQPEMPAAPSEPNLAAPVETAPAAGIAGPEIAPPGASQRVGSLTDEAKTATHADPGQPPQSATPQTISGSLNKEPVDYKTARKDLLASIDAAIKRTPDRNILPLTKRGRPDEEAIAQAGHVEFKVPGDGKFRVVNSRDTLQRFRDRVAKSRGFSSPKAKASPKPSFSGGVGATVREFLTEGDHWNAYQLAKLQGAPFRFGMDDKGNPVPYTDAQGIKVANIPAFVGRDVAGKWRVIEPQTGLAMGPPATTRDAAIMASTRKAEPAGAEKIQGIIRDAIKTANQNKRPVGQDALEQAYAKIHSGEPAAPAEPIVADQEEPVPAAVHSEPPDMVKSAGEAYAGQRSIPFSGAEHDTTLSAKPIRREDVLNPLLKALGVPLYQGRVKGRGMERVLGYYRPFQEAVRNRRMSDIETAAHELAHLIDDRIFNGFNTRKGKPNIRPWKQGNTPLWKIYVGELRSVSYDAKKVYEGFAEYIRHWMTNPQYAYDKAPEFTKWWDKFVATSKYGPALREAQKGMTAWMEQGLVNRAASKVGGNQIDKILDDSMRTWTDDIRQSVFDDLHGVLKLETTSTGKLAAEDLGPYQTTRLTRAAAAVVDGVLHYGPVKRMSGGHWDFVGRNGETRVSKIQDASGKVGYVMNPRFESWGLHDVLAPVWDHLDEWKQYAIGRSAQELMEQRRENLFSRPEIEAMLALGKDRPAFAKVFEDYQAWNGKILDFAQDMGLIDPDERARYRREQYIPFYRVGQRPGARKIGGIEGNVKAVYKLKGGDRNINDVVENMIMNAKSLISEAIKNQARESVVDYAMRHAGGGRFLTQIPKDTTYTSIDKGQILDEIVRSMVGMSVGQYKRAKPFMPIEAQQAVDAVLAAVGTNMPEWVRFMKFNQTPQDGRRVIAVLRGGKPQFYEVGDPYLYRAFEAFNRPAQRGALMRALNAVRRLGQTSVTLTADFMLANITRDSVNASIFSKHGFIPFYDSVRGLAERMRRGPYYSLMIANGGGMSSYLSDPKDLEFHIKNFYNKQGLNWRWVMNTPRRALVGLEILADAVEMSTRIGEFRRDLRSGEQPRVGAYNSREISTDFAMRGDNAVLNVMYDIVPFLKAGMVSLERAYRGSRKDYNRMHVWINATMLAAASAYLYTLNRGNPEYDRLQDWEKNSYWHLFAGGHHLRLPKIWEAGALSTVAERMTEATINQMEGHPSWSRSSGTAAKAVGNLFYLSWQPALIAPLYDVYATGKDSFTGNSIIPPGMENLQPFAQYSPYTSPTLIHLAAQTAGLPTELQFSPARAQELLLGYLHGWGGMGLQIADRYLYGKEMPAPRQDEVPGLRRFVRSEPLRNTQAEQDFYNFFHETDSLAQTTAAMIKRFRPDIAQLYSEKDQTHLEKAAKKVADAAASIRDKQVKILQDPDLTPDQKRTQIDELQRQKNDMFDEAMNQLEPYAEGKQAAPGSGR